MKLSIKLLEAENEFIANCPELDVNCYGADRSEAVRRLRNVLRFYMDSAQEFGLAIEQFDDVSIEGEHIPLALSDTLNLPATRTVN
jgi:predicted RNase H-like HicB family nuclease